MLPTVRISGQKTTTWGELYEFYWSDLSQKRWREFISDIVPVQLDTLEISDDINHRSSASLTVLDFSKTYDIKKGQWIEIYDGDALVFGGIIDSVVEKIVLGSDIKTIDVSAVDYTVLAERRVTSYAYDDYIFAGEVVYDIWSDILSSEGIAIGEIHYGEELPRVVFSLKKVSEIFDTLAAISGYIWFIDYDKKLYFVERSTFASEYDITDYSNILDISVTDGNPQYRNVQYVFGSDVRTGQRIEEFRGDGSQKTFVVGYKIIEEPTIYVNNVIQSVGIKGVDSDKAWYWSKNEPSITQDANASPLSSSDILRVEYVGVFSLIIKTTQYSEITARKLVEGFGTGKYEAVEIDTNASDYDQALATARGILKEYATIGKQVSYRTLLPISSGSLQRITLPDFRIDSDFLITSVRITFDNGACIYEVTAASGPVDPSWEDIFCKIAKNAREKTYEAMSVQDVVQGLEEFSKTYAYDDVPNPLRVLTPGMSPTPENTYFPCFDVMDRFKYCVLYSNGIEFFRKPVTYIEDDEKVVTCITIINADEANGVTISHIGLWGGDTATSAKGSGIELMKFAYGKSKSTLESLQINIYIERGWV